MLCFARPSSPVVLIELHLMSNDHYSKNKSDLERHLVLLV